MADPTDVITDDPGELRAALIDQLRYLVDEVEALKGIIDRVPEPVQAGRPLPDALTLKEIYGTIAAEDAEVHLPRLRAMVEAEGAPPAFEPVSDEVLAEDEAWNEQSMDTILDRLQDARRDLVAFLEALPLEAWAQTATFSDETHILYEVVHGIMQTDTDRLRTVSHRLHDTNLTGRKRDLPK